MTSISEGLPLVLIEAMSQGTVPIAFDVRVGPKSIISNNETGYLIPDGNFEEYIDCVISYIKYYKNSNTIEENALKRAQDFSKEVVMSKWIEILDRKNNYE